MNKREFLLGSSALLASFLAAGCKKGPLSARSANSTLPAFTRCVSLAVLQERLLAECPRGDCGVDALLSLAGLTRLDGYLVDRAQRDVVLVGPVEQGRLPILHTGEFVVALRSATHRYLDQQGRFSHPGVSLDPQPEVVKRLMNFDASGISGDGPKAQQAIQNWKQICQSPQNVRVIGLRREGSHYLYVIELADEVMKSYVDGTIALPGLEVPSQIMLARRAAAFKNGTKTLPQMGFSMSRYWFNAGTVRCAVDADAALLLQCDVRLSTEAQMLASNKLEDSGQRDDLADRCAASFTKLLPSLAAEAPLYQELINIYRTQSIAVTLADRKVLQAAGLNLDPLLDRWQVPLQKVPAQVPGRWAIAGEDFRQELPNGYSILKVRIPSCGGVVVNPKPDAIDHARNKRFIEMKRVALAARPKKRGLYWDVATG